MNSTTALESIHQLNECVSDILKEDTGSMSYTRNGVPVMISWRTEDSKQIFIVRCQETENFGSGVLSSLKGEDENRDALEKALLMSVSRPTTSGLH